MKHEAVRALAELTGDELRLAVGRMAEADARVFDSSWPDWAHAGQTPGHDDWRVWVLLAGRGFGKTRAGAEYVAGFARDHPGASIALVGATVDEARAVMVEGRSGLIAVARAEEREAMVWKPSRRRLVFASGAEAFLYSAANPESLRGPEHHFAWCGELAKWRLAKKAWDNLRLGLRVGERPRALVTTTPRPTAALKRILGLQGTVLTGGASRANPHLPDDFIAAVEEAHAGTRFGRQELDGVLIEDVEGTLWPRDLIEKSRSGDGDSHFPHGRAESAAAARESDCPFLRVVVGVDPPASADGDACGIVVVGLGAQGGGSGGGVGGAPGGGGEEQWRGHGGDGAEGRRHRPARDPGPRRRRQGRAGRAGRGTVRARQGEIRRALPRARGRAGGADLWRRLPGPREEPRPGGRDGLGADRAHGEAGAGAAQGAGAVEWGQGYEWGQLRVTVPA